MKFLYVNAGSSSLKFQLVEMPEEKVIISGYIEKIGADDSFWNTKVNGKKIKGAILHSDMGRQYQMAKYQEKIN